MALRTDLATALDSEIATASTRERDEVGASLHWSSLGGGLYRVRIETDSGIDWTSGDFALPSEPPENEIVRTYLVDVIDECNRRRAERNLAEGGTVERG